MKEIRLRFVDGGGWDSQVIKYATRCTWSHVEAMFDEVTTIGAMLQGGVKSRNISDRAYKDVLTCEIVPIKVTELEYSKFWAFLATQIGTPYDWRAIISFGLGERDWRSEDSWFCSELQTRALEVAGLVTIPDDLPIDRITPRDLWLLVKCQNLIHCP